MPKKSFGYLNTDDKSCFLCGTTRAPITKEHVFPKWLQNRFDLWNQTLGLLNKSRIKYRSLLIPCCSICNREHLSRLENTISTAVSSGYKACAELDDRQLYLWAGKLYFGILRKEIALSHERSKPGSDSIFSKESLESFSQLHLFLQGIRNRHEFQGESPYSVLICNLHDLGNRRNYCFRDSLFHMTLAIRMGDVGLIVAFEDSGLTKSSYGRYVDEIAGRKLHPIQFDELSAKVLYQVSRLQGGVTYITSKSESKAQPFRTLVMGGGRLRENSQQEYSQVLRAYVSNWLRGRRVKWFVPPSFVPTWMADDRGCLLIRTLDEWESGEGDSKQAKPNRSKVLR